jgi:hypothetical protein
MEKGCKVRGEDGDKMQRSGQVRKSGGEDGERMQRSGQVKR